MGRLKEVHALSLPEKPLQGYSPCRKHTGRVLEVQRGQTAFGTGQVTPVTAMLIIILAEPPFRATRRKLGRDHAFKPRGRVLNNIKVLVVASWADGRKAVHFIYRTITNSTTVSLIYSVPFCRQSHLKVTPPAGTC